MEKELSGCVEEVNKLAAEKGIQEMALTTTLAYVYRQGAFNEQSPSITVKGAYAPDKAAQKDEFCEKASELLGAKNMPCDFDINIKLKGTKFPTLTKLVPVMQDAPTAQEVAPKPGEVTLFDFWATWCGPCQGPMGHNQEMLEHHPEWAGKARIVGVSIDNAVDAPRKRITEKGWTKVDHYWAEGAWGSDACKAFGIQGIPFCVLVDKTGTIQLTGHPASMDLEHNIPALMADGKISGGADEDEPALKDSSYSYETSKKELEEFVKSHDKDLAAVGNVLMASVFNRKADAGKFVDASAFLVVRFTWSKKSSEACKHIKEGIEATFGKKMATKMQDKEMKMFEVAFGEKCGKCGAALGTCDQYLCVQCKPAFYLCKACGDAHPNPTELSQLPHPHGLYYIQKESGPVLDSLVLGDLKTTGSGIANKVHSSCCCDICGTQPQGIRWKCAVCPQGDFCEACFAARDPANPKHEETVKKAKEGGHDMNTHVYIKQEFAGFVGLPY